MAYVDPWGGFNQGLGYAQQAYEMKRQQDAADIAKAEEARRQKEYEYQVATREGLGSIYNKANEKTTEEYADNPNFKTYDLQKTGGDILSSSLPSRAESMDQQSRAEVMDKGPTLASAAVAPMTGIVPEPAKKLTREVPKYSREELDNEAATFAASRGDWEALKGMGSFQDITSKIDKRHMDTIKQITDSIRDMRKAGIDVESIKRIAKQNANNLNRLNGRIVFDPAMLDNIDVNAAGDLVTKDMGGGQVLALISQPDGRITAQLIDTTKGQRVANTSRQLDLSEERLKQGWARLNPRLQAELEASKAAGKKESEEVIKMKDAYYNAQDANKLLDDAEAIFNKDPRQIAGTLAKVRAWIGEIDPALEEALRSGDRKEFSRLMMNNADTFKKLLGPQISNSDAELMFKLSGATASSPAEIRATFKTLRKRNDDTIRQYERRAGGLGGPAPATTPYTGYTPKAPASDKPFTRETIQGIVANFSKDMKPGTSRKVDFKGRRGTVTKDVTGRVIVTLD